MLLLLSKISGANRNIQTAVPSRTGFAFRCLSLDKVIGDEFEEYDDIEKDAQIEIIQKVKCESFQVVS